MKDGRNGCTFWIEHFVSQHFGQCSGLPLCPCSYQAHFNGPSALQVYRLIQIDFQQVHITIALVFPNIYLTPVNSWPATDSMSKHTQPLPFSEGPACRIPLAWKPVFPLAVVSIWTCSFSAASHHSLFCLLSSQSCCREALFFMCTLESFGVDFPGWTGKTPSQSLLSSRLYSDVFDVSFFFLCFLEKQPQGQGHIFGVGYSPLCLEVCQH